MKRQNTILGVLVTGTILIGSCAKVGSPSGGPKDNLPPVVLESYPQNGSSHFSGNKFTITFDEYVKIDEVSAKLMTSPPLSKKPDVSMKGKSVVVEFEDDLRDSITYTFYFQDAIQDLNEGNAIENFQYVFSTGDVVDSLSLKGFVYNSLSLDPPETALVALYRNVSDTAFTNLLPDYITNVLKDGSFRIDNIREGRYKVFGLVDQDNSKNFNISEESVAFIDSLIVISSETNFYGITNDLDTINEVVADSQDVISDHAEIYAQDDSTLIDKTKSSNDKYIDYELLLFQPEKTVRYMTSSTRSSSYGLLFTLSLPPDSNNFDFVLPDASIDDYLIERSVANDTMFVWLLDTAFSNKQTIKPIVSYPFTDSIGNIVQKTDTVSLRYSAPRTAGNRRVALAPSATEIFKVSSNFTSGSISPINKLKFLADVPFGSIDTSKLVLYAVKDTSKTAIAFNLERDSIHFRELSFSANLIPGEEYLFIADSAAFFDVRDNASDSTSYKLSINTDDKYGKIILKITGYDGAQIIQLLSQKDEKIIREYYSSGKAEVEMPFIDKGTYKIRVVFDVDNNKKWTTGDYYTKKQPEPVSYFPEDIEVKANWEQIYDWDISSKNYKKNRVIKEK